MGHYAAEMQEPRDPRPDFTTIIGNITYKDWTLLLVRDSAGREYMRWQWFTRCVKSGASVMISGRRWWLSPKMTESEIVQTALLAALTAEEHEARESFRYKDKRVFNPHISVPKLLEICEIEDAREGY